MRMVCRGSSGSGLCLNSEQNNLVQLIHCSLIRKPLNTKSITVFVLNLIRNRQAVNYCGVSLNARVFYFHDMTPSVITMQLDGHE